MKTWPGRLLVVSRMATLALAAQLLLDTAQASPEGGASSATADAGRRAHHQIGYYEFAYPFPDPDGESLIFQGNLDGRWQLYRMKLEDESFSRVHSSEWNDIQPALSADGSQLAFTSDRSGDWDIYLLDIATGSVRSLSPHPLNDGHPKWSEDGQWIYFNRTVESGPADDPLDDAIYRIHPDGSGLELVSNSSNAETFSAPSPDGKSVAFVEWFPLEGKADTRNGEIIVLEIATGKRTNITQVEAFDGYPYWGASGKWIYYSSQRLGPSGRLEFAIFRTSPNGGVPEQITALDGRSDVRGVPTRDEKKLIFNQSDNGGDHGARVQLFLQELP